MAEECFKVPKLTKREVMALQALKQGTADAYQQRLVLAVISNKFCRTQDVLFIVNAPDQTAFLNGRAFAGMQILKTLNIKVGQLQDDEEQDQ